MLRLVVNKVYIQQRNLVSSRLLCTDATTKKKGKAQVTAGVAGLSDKCVKVPGSPVGPGAAKNKEYKNPEYFCYNVDSFAEAEVELAKYRLPAPSNKVPFQR